MPFNQCTNSATVFLCDFGKRHIPLCNTIKPVLKDCGEDKNIKGFQVHRNDRNGITLNIHRSHVKIRVGMHMCMDVHTYKVKNYRWGRVCLENWLWGILYILEEKSFYVGKLGHQSHLEAFALWSKQYNWLQQSGMLFILNMDSFQYPWYIEPFFSTFLVLIWFWYNYILKRGKWK